MPTVLSDGVVASEAAQKLRSSHGLYPGFNLDNYTDRVIRHLRSSEADVDDLALLLDGIQLGYDHLMRIGKYCALSAIGAVVYARCWADARSVYYPEELAELKSYSPRAALATALAQVWAFGRPTEPGSPERSRDLLLDLFERTEIHQCEILITMAYDHMQEPYAPYQGRSWENKRLRDALEAGLLV